MERLVTAFRHYQRSVDALDELGASAMGVNRTDARVLDLLQEHGRMTAGEIAQGAALTSGAVTGVLDRLEAAGYATRVRDEEDRRRVLVEPTTKMDEQVQVVYAPLGAKGARAMRKYTDEELELAARIVEDATAMYDEQIAEVRARGPSRGSPA